MIHSLGLVLLSCLFLRSESTETGKVLPPQNLSLIWESDFIPRLSWDPPQLPSTQCYYNLERKAKTGVQNDVSDTTFSGYVTMEGGSLLFSVQTVCGDIKSEPAVLQVMYPDLVTALDCYSYTATLVNCSWSPAGHTSDLRFSYRLVNENSDEPSVELQECSLYISSGGVRTGCNLQATTSQSIHIVFHATLNNTLVRNTFWNSTLYHVRPPPLTWTVTETKDSFNISWIPPDMLDLSAWVFVINYTHCDKHKSIKVKVLSYELSRVAHCRCCISIEAESQYGKTPQSDRKCFEADMSDNLLVYAAVIIPLVLALLTALAFLCCWKNKDSIFPKVPGPRDLLSDISNNNESFLCKLYTPTEKDENCTITLIVDTQTNKPEY